MEVDDDPVPPDPNTTTTTATTSEDVRVTSKQPAAPREPAVPATRASALLPETPPAWLAGLFSDSGGGALGRRDPGADGGNDSSSSGGAVASRLVRGGTGVMGVYGPGNGGSGAASLWQGAGRGSSSGGDVDVEDVRVPSSSSTLLITQSQPLCWFDIRVKLILPFLPSL